MNKPERQITNVLLRASADLGHGGAAYEYRIDADGANYLVMLKISRSFPTPGERSFQPSELVEILTKDNRQVEMFLEKLSERFNVFALGDLKPRHPFLHPTFYSFCFQDSSGADHSFDYSIECSEHLDEKYRQLVQTFDSFFERKRIFDKFFEQGERGKSDSKGWWKFW